MDEVNEKEMNEQYEKLKPFMFPHIFDKLSGIDEKCDNISKQILQTNRKVIYTLYAAAFSDNVKGSEKIEDILNSGNQIPKDPLSILEPLEVQSITVFLKDIISDPPKFVNALLSFSKSPDFLYCAIFTVPAIYSFFSTKESAGFAFNFYIELARKANFDTFSNCVSPFLNSTICSSFTNILFKKLFWSAFEKKYNETTLCQAMLDYFVAYFKYIPEQVAILIRMLTLTWPMIDVWKLIARNFLFPQYLIHKLSCPFAYNPLFSISDDKVKTTLSLIGNEKKKCKLIIPKIEFGSSYKELPETFIPYQHSFAIGTILTIKDIKNLVAMNIEIPHHTNRLQQLIEKTSKDPLAPFQINFFPKFLVPPQITYRNLFKFPTKSQFQEVKKSSLAQLWSAFETAAEPLRADPLELLKKKPIRTGEAILDLQMNTSVNIPELYRFGLQTRISELTKTANILELLLQHNMSLSGLGDWLETCMLALDVYSMQIAEIIVNKLNVKPEQAFASLWTLVYENHYDSPQLGLWIAIDLLSIAEPLILKKYKKEFASMNKKYHYLLSIKNSTIEAAPMFSSKALKSHMWETNGILQFANEKTPLATRYILLIAFIEQIELLIAAAGFEDSVDKTKEILNFSFAEGMYTWIFNTMVILNFYLFNNDNFASYASPSLFDKWRRFSAAFIQFISDDEQLVFEYGEMLSPKE